MPMPAAPASPADAAAPPAGPAVLPMQPPLAAAVVPDAFAKDAIIAWFRGEFAAANAIIDALCSHLAQLAAATGGSEYESLFAAIHRRRLNWIPVLQMQKYHSIADVAVELRRVAANKLGSKDHHGPVADQKEGDDLKLDEKVPENLEDGVNGGEHAAGEDDSLDSDITDSGSQEVQPTLENTNICSNHEDCSSRHAQIKLTKGFTAKEPVKGHMVNVLKGLKVYEHIFTDAELSKLTDFVNELRVAGENGELSGESFVLFNKQIKGNKREMIQFGVPIFGQIKEEANINHQSTIEPIPALLQGVIDHLVLWNLLPESRKPNSCIINFFDEGEYSQPFVKPPHLDQPVSTLLLSESTMAFGRSLVSDSDGNYRAPLTLSLKEGSLLVMRGNSADVAGHAMCPSAAKRISITFFKVHQDSSQFQSPLSPISTTAMTVWQPGAPSQYPMSYEATDVTSKWGVVRGPVVMLAPVGNMVLSPRRLPCGGTGVFLPWTMGSRKPAKHLPPRAQRGRILASASPSETHSVESASESGDGVK